MSALPNNQNNRNNDVERSSQEERRETPARPLRDVTATDFVDRTTNPELRAGGNEPTPADSVSGASTADDIAAANSYPPVADRSPPFQISRPFGDNLPPEEEYRRAQEVFEHHRTFATYREEPPLERATATAFDTGRPTGSPVYTYQPQPPAFTQVSHPVPSRNLGFQFDPTALDTPYEPVDLSTMSEAEAADVLDCIFTHAVPRQAYYDDRTRSRMFLNVLRYFICNGTSPNMSPHEQVPLLYDETMRVCSSVSVGAITECAGGYVRRFMRAYADYSVTLVRSDSKLRDNLRARNLHADPRYLHVAFDTASAARKLSVEERREIQRYRTYTLRDNDDHTLP